MISLDLLLAALLEQFYPEPQLVNQDFLRAEITKLLAEHGAAYEAASDVLAAANRHEDDRHDDQLLETLREKRAAAAEPLVHGLLRLCALSHMARCIDMRDCEYESLWQLMRGVLDEAHS
jgi:hypothetical protein